MNGARNGIFFLAPPPAAGSKGQMSKGQKVKYATYLPDYVNVKERKIMVLTG